MKKLKVSVVGLGYIGLPTATIISNNGFDVLGVDVNKEVVNSINIGKIHIVESGLESLVKNSVNKGVLRASENYEESDIFIIAVPTPLDDNQGPDLSFIKSAANSIAPHLKKGNLIILESTVPVGATEQLNDWLKEKRLDLIFPEFGKDIENKDISVAYCPERVLPGNVVDELINNDRTIGGISSKCSDEAESFYKSFIKGNTFITDSRTAELTKLVENSYRDLNIAFANELSLIADKLNINVWELISLSNHHPRVNILQPGPGVGGHCIAVDPWFIVHSAPDESKLIKQSRIVNDDKPLFVINKVSEAVKKINKPIGTLTIATLGLTFKQNIDDLRESPALEISLAIKDMGFDIQLVVEPNISILPVEFGKSSSELCSTDIALSKADIVLILVDHAEFYKIQKGSLTDKLIIDTKGIIN